MRRRLAVFSTDEVNRQKMRFAASALMNAEEQLHRKCLNAGFSPGVPVHIQHDMTRLIGWTCPVGLHIDNSMARLIGFIDEAETTEELLNYSKRATSYWNLHHTEGTAKYRDDLMQRAGLEALASVGFFLSEAAMLAQTNIASTMYSNFFSPSEEYVDKDGLVDVGYLRTQTKEIQPGVFHEPKRNLLLFAHRFFRRSLSHKNKLNTYFLEQFRSLTGDDARLRTRIRLDPDIVGHPDSLRPLIELEYWHGPRFNEDISSIPNGVAEHKADERSRYFEGIDRTQFWWKAPEVRRTDAGLTEYRTFEMEELTENVPEGLGDQKFGCRYAHTEYSQHSAAINHFDGAIRAYEASAYFARIDTSIDRAGKQAQYTKLFRLDGSLEIDKWKTLICSYFRGNRLVPEYLGAPEADEDATLGSASDDGVTGVNPSPDQPRIAALINLTQGSIERDFEICPEYYLNRAGTRIGYTETGNGNVAIRLKDLANASIINTIVFDDKILNLSPIRYGNAKKEQCKFAATIKELADALQEDFASDVTRQASVPIAWEQEGIIITLTLAGCAAKVAEGLRKVSELVDPAVRPSKWVNELARIINKLDPERSIPIDWEAVQGGLLRVSRAGPVTVEFHTAE